MMHHDDEKNKVNREREKNEPGKIFKSNFNKIAK